MDIRDILCSSLLLNIINQNIKDIHISLIVFEKFECVFLLFQDLKRKLKQDGFA